MASPRGDPASHPISTLQEGMTGSCLCGSIKITVKQKDLFNKPNGHICHCINCRKSTGSAYASLLMLPSANVEISDPKGCLKTYLDYDTGSGNPLPRSFCSNCGSTVGEFHPLEKWTWLNLGIFPRIPQPEFEVFVAHRQGWMKPVTEGAKQYRFVEELKNYK